MHHWYHVHSTYLTPPHIPPLAPPPHSPEPEGLSGGLRPLLAEQPGGLVVRAGLGHLVGHIAVLGLLRERRALLGLMGLPPRHTRHADVVPNFVTWAGYIGRAT